MNAKREVVYKEHPLARVALELFRNGERHDKWTIAQGLCGATILKDPRGGGDSAISAYITVARDVLGCLEEAGVIERKESGWYEAKIVEFRGEVVPYPTTADFEKMWTRWTRNRAYTEEEKNLCEAAWMEGWRYSWALCKPGGNIWDVLEE